MNHRQHAVRAQVNTPCTAQHLTFGGKCLNCGYTPKPKRVLLKPGTEFVVNVKRELEPKHRT